MAKKKTSKKKEVQLDTVQTNHESPTRLQNSKIKFVKLQNKKFKLSVPKYTRTSTKKKTNNRIKRSTDKKTPKTHQEAKVSKRHVSKPSRDDYQVSQRKTYLIFTIILIPILTISSYLMAGILQPERETNYYGLEIRCDGNESESIMTQDCTRKIFYIKNHNSEPVTLSFFTTNWDPPEAFNTIEVSWDYNETTIPPRTTYKIVFTIVNRSPNKLNNFNFNIDFIAHGVKS